MPEIAEVRVVANTLKKELIDKKINNVKVLYPKIINGNTNEFVKIIKNQKFKDIKTCGKWLLFILGEYTLLSHLRMEGKYFYVPNDKEIEKHTHIIFELENNMDLRYNDTRKFGRMILVKTDDIYETEYIKKLGLEPDDKNLNALYLETKLKNKKIPIKEALLDQTIINGLGNIYANEVLYASKISPLRQADSLTKKELEDIIHNSSRIILKSVSVGGCTIRSYTSGLGVIGHYQDYLKVHGKKICECGTEISKVRIAGRSAYYCKNCQK